MALLFLSQYNAIDLDGINTVSELLRPLGVSSGKKEQSGGNYTEWGLGGPKPDAAIGMPGSRLLGNFLQTSLIVIRPWEEPCVLFAPQFHL